jgi:hypothetical protein
MDHFVDVAVGTFMGVQYSSIEVIVAAVSYAIAVFARPVLEHRTKQNVCITCTDYLHEYFFRLVMHTIVPTRTYVLYTKKVGELQHPISIDGRGFLFRGCTTVQYLGYD